MSLLKGTPCPACGVPLPAADEWIGAQRRTRVLPGKVELSCPGCGQRWAVSSGRLIAVLLAFAIALLGTCLLLAFGFGFEDMLTHPSDRGVFGFIVFLTVPATLFVMWAAPRFLRLVAVSADGSV